MAQNWVTVPACFSATLGWKSVIKINQNTHHFQHLLWTPNRAWCLSMFLHHHVQQLSEHEWLPLSLIDRLMITPTQNKGKRQRFYSWFWNIVMWVTSGANDTQWHPWEICLYHVKDRYPLWTLTSSSAMAERQCKAWYIRITFSVICKNHKITFFGHPMKLSGAI